jgi:purine-nucleoside phosphorylase
MLQKIEDACKYIENHWNKKPEVGIVLGTGLGALVNDIEIDVEMDYSDIPHFPLSTVEFHSGKLIFGKLKGKDVVVMKGRFHFYEGYSMQMVTFPIRVMHRLGVKKLFVSNASGGINRSFRKSDIMLITDHIHLISDNPLIGLSDPAYGDRFPDMSEAYDHELLSLGRTVARDLGIPYQEGIFASVSGPNIETQAEYRYLEIVGADAVGMSTTPEVIVANQLRLPVFAVSCITDEAFPEVHEKVTIASVLAAAAEAEPKMTALITEMMGRL